MGPWSCWSSRWSAALDQLEGDGFPPVVPPVLVREEAMYGTGFLPTDRAQIYEVAEDDLYLVGTSEVRWRGSTATRSWTRTRFRCDTAASPPASGARRARPGDTRGIFRVHQFDKVEMFSFVAATSGDEHERLLAIEEAILQAIEVPYRVVNIAAGDLGASRPRSTTARRGSRARARIAR